jgi:hypothetical protein
VEKVVGIVLRGNKSGNYRSEQYAKLKICEEIKLNVKDLDKILFLDSCSFENLVVEKDNNVKFHLKVNDESIKNKIAGYLTTEFKATENNNIFSCTYKLKDTIKGKKLYSLLIENNGTRFHNDIPKNESDKNKNFHDTKCPVISFEYAMLYHINVILKNKIETDETFKKNFSNNLEAFEKFLNLIKNDTLDDKTIFNNALKNDMNYFIENSTNLSLYFSEQLKKIKKEEKTFTIEEMSEKVVKIGDTLHKLIVSMIKKLIDDFNFDLVYKIPNIKLNLPYLTENFWCVLDPFQQHQNLQIAINAGHLQNQYYFFDEKARNEAKKTMLEVLKKYISQEQSKDLEKNMLTDEFSF